MQQGGHYCRPSPHSRVPAATFGVTLAGLQVIAHCHCYVVQGVPPANMGRLLRIGGRPAGAEVVVCQCAIKKLQGGGGQGRFARAHAAIS